MIVQSIPYHPDALITGMEIDGVTYTPPLVDSKGRVYANAYAVGASEVKGVIKQTGSDSTTRVTVVTPTSGKKLRILSIEMLLTGTTGTVFEFYFGTGASITTTPANAISICRLIAATEGIAFRSWPDGGGPVGAVNAVLSFRSQANIAAAGMLVVHYREE